MDENTVFQGQQPPGIGSSLSVQPPPAAGSPPPPKPVQPTVNAGANVAPISPPPSYIEEESSFLPSFISLGNIIKAVLGIVVLIVLVFVVVRFVVPFFSPKDTTVKLTYWGLWEDKNVMDSLISDFERNNPKIDIEYKKEDPKQYQQRLLTRIKQEGTGPDIFRFHNTWLPVLSDILTPLPTDVITAAEFKDAYYPVAQKDLMQNGAIYGIALEIDTLALFVNTEILDASGVSIPTTWDEFGRTARVLTVKEGDKIKTAGAAMGTFDNINHAPDIVSLLFVQNGANLKDLASTMDNASDTLDFYTQFAKPDANVWDDTLDTSLLAFAKGNLAMYFGYSWDVLTIKAVNHPQLNFKIVPVPHLSDRKMSIASYWAEGVSLKSKHKQEAFLFLKFLSQKETSQKLYAQASKLRLFGEPYAHRELAGLLKDNELVYPFVAQAEDAMSSFFASDTHDNSLNKQMNNYLGDAIRSVLDNTSAQTAVETLSQGVTQVLAQYEK